MWRSARIVLPVIVAAIAAFTLATPVLAQWPTTRVNLNDIVEAHSGNDGNVGIYQRVFGEQAGVVAMHSDLDLALLKLSSCHPLLSWPSTDRRI